MASFKQHQYPPPILQTDQYWGQDKTGVLQRQVECWYRAQAEITAGLEQGVRPQGYHHTITDIQRSSATHALPETRDRWEIQGGMRSLLRQDFGCHAQLQRVQGCQRHFGLRQIRLSISAVTKLQRPLRGYGLVATRTGIVRAPAFRSSIIPRTSWILYNLLKNLLKKTTVRFCCCFGKSGLSRG
jgi:hypothetical protein